MNRIFTSLVIIVFLIVTVSAQQTVVQSLTYDSTSRAMVVEFPEGDHNQYEKILMYYSMRCKDGLISTGAERNKGCGEWDYSCNTYITDSTRIDSFSVIAPSHVIDGYTESTFDYAIEPTYSYYQSSLKNVSYNNTNSEVDYAFDAGSDDVMLPVGNNIAEKKTQFLYKRADLSADGLTAGLISGLKFPVESGTGNFPRLRVRMAHSEIEALDGSTIHDDLLEEVFYDDVDVSTSELFIKFYSDFIWDGNKNILVEISHSASSDNSITFQGGTTTYASSLSCDGDDNAAFYSEGGASLEIDQDINFAGDEITVALWFWGSDAHPVNSTIFEAVDSNNNRQINAHLPWGDGVIYWDCGNDGSGYDRISKTADEYDEIKRWNHWTFTKNANTGFMRIYLNGEPWLARPSKKNAINFKTLRVGASVNEARKSFGSINDFKIFDKELSPAEIHSIMSRQIEPGQSLYDNMIVNYDFNQLGSGPIIDNSQNDFHANVVGNADAKYSLGRFLLNEAKISKVLPDITFVRGSYDRTVNQQLVLDSLVNSPYFITEYEVIDNVLQIKDEYSFYLSGFVPVFDEFGELVDGRFIEPDGSISIDNLEYFLERPSKYEIMSFVTPYGIGIDFGLAGKTWVFDVTDFGPILKGRKRLSLERGGQNQEEMDIKFVFIDGIPTRDVVDIRQVWPVTAETYTRIINNTRFEERTLTLPNAASEYALTAAITGHGQEGEFVPQMHYLNVNGGNREMEWQVWKECSDNPIYPQGGTWIYDRAGWCPGAPTDVRRLPLENVNPGDQISVDYGVNTALGDSRYIVNVQLISYGEANFNLDAELVDIINPSPRPEFERFNPMCGSPRIKIRNTGKTRLTRAQIIYGVEGRTVQNYYWSGSLGFLEEEEIELYPLKLDQNSVAHEFYARIANANGRDDDYLNNNEKKTIIPFMPAHTNDIVIEMKTNGRANETSWKLFDENGVEMAGRGGGLTANTTYRDTVIALEGCYELWVEDSDEDGISWWANSDGNGYVQIRNIGGGITTVATDFGKYVRYQFVTEGYLPNGQTENSKEVLSIYPNPGFNEFTIKLPAGELNERLTIYNAQGAELLDFPDKSLQNGEIQFRMDNFPSGLYIAELMTANGTTNIQFIKE